MRQECLFYFFYHCCATALKSWFACTFVTCCSINTQMMEFHDGKQSAPRSRQITHYHLITQIYRPDALPDAQPTVSKHWRQICVHLIDKPVELSERIKACIALQWERYCSVDVNIGHPAPRAACCRSNWCVTYIFRYCTCVLNSLFLYILRYKTGLWMRSTVSLWQRIPSSQWRVSWASK